MSSFLFNQFGSIPVNSQTLKSVLRKNKSSVCTISSLRRRGIIISLRRDLYLCMPEPGEGTWSRGVIANHIIHPSYVSYETVLSRAGVISERKHLYKSSCLRRGKTFENETGSYEYIQVSEDYFPVGLVQRQTEDGHCYLEATPEKALCDIIVTTPNLRIQTVKYMLFYLDEYLGADWNAVANMDLSILYKCLEKANKKKNALSFLIEAIERERSERAQ